MGDIGDAVVDKTMDLMMVQALNGVPRFYDVPEELREIIEKRTMATERMFWLRATLINKDPITEAILRRAFYAESRCWEMENRAAEISLIASGMKAEIERLNKLVEDAE